MIWFSTGSYKVVLDESVYHYFAQQRINQIISQGGKEVERVLPKILRGATEDVYQTPFRLLGVLESNN